MRGQSIFKGCDVAQTFIINARKIDIYSYRHKNPQKHAIKMLCATAVNLHAVYDVVAAIIDIDRRRVLWILLGSALLG